MFAHRWLSLSCGGVYADSCGSEDFAFVKALKSVPYRYTDRRMVFKKEGLQRSQLSERPRVSRRRYSKPQHCRSEEHPVSYLVSRRRSHSFEFPPLRAVVDSIVLRDFDPFDKGTVPKSLALAEVPPSTEFTPPSTLALP